MPTPAELIEARLSVLKQELSKAEKTGAGYLRDGNLSGALAAKEVKAALRERIAMLEASLA